MGIFFGIYVLFRFGALSAEEPGTVLVPGRPCIIFFKSVYFGKGGQPGASLRHVPSFSV